MSFTPNPDGMRRVVEEATRKGAALQVAEIERVTAGLRCPTHGKAPIFLGPWPSMNFDDFCCDSLRDRVVTALEPLEWVRLNQAA